MERLIRTLLALVGVAALLGCSVLMVLSPRVALELLLLTSPVYVAVWLVVMLTAGNLTRRRAIERGSVPAPETWSAVLARDGGRCTVCGGAGSAVIARRPARRGEADRLARFATLCAACAATSALPVLVSPTTA